MQKAKKIGIPLLLSLVLVSLILGSSPALLAEKRTYEVQKPAKKAMVIFLDELALVGIKFKVEDVYTADNGGRSGFQLRLLPYNSICEIFFFQDPKQKNRSLVQVFTQNVADGQRIDNVLVQKLNMRELGVNRWDKKNSENWPVDPNEHLLPPKKQPRR